MKRLLTTTATAMLLGTGAFAESHMNLNQYEFQAGADFYATDLIGMRVYSSEQEFGEEGNVAAGSEQNWDDIGEINDLIVTKDGQLEAVIVGVGGFLGLGEKDVAMSMDKIKVLNEEGDSNDRFLVINASEEMLENAPAYERATGDGMAEQGMAEGDTEMAADPSIEETNEEVAEGTGEAASGTEQTADDAAAETEEAADAAAMEAEEAGTGSDPVTMATDRVRLARPAVEREGYSEATASELEADDLTNAPVYGPNDETVGEIDEVLLAEGGQVDRVVVNVGGFLGMGEKPVGVTFDELQILRNQGGDVRIYIDSDKEALESQPEWDG